MRSVRKGPLPEIEKLADQVTTGISGLDDVLGGGLAHGRLTLIEGLPGTGKTTLAMQFLLEGARRGERVLCLSLAETEEEMKAIGESHGWSLDGIEICDLSPTDENLQPGRQNTMFHPSEVELREMAATIQRKLEETKASRVVLDSLSELRLLSGNPLRYRRQILLLKRIAASMDCTMLLLDDRPELESDVQVRTLAHGILHLEQLHPEYGAERRRLKVVKYRGVKARGGYHDFVIRRGGLVVFPRIVAAETRHASTREKIGSGIPEFDALLGGGIERGTSTLISGSPGTGKSSLAARFVLTAAEKGQRGAIFFFDESRATFLLRMKGLGMDLEKHVDEGRITLRQVDPAELSPGEFGHSVASAAEREGTSIVVIDSLNGYLHAMPEERFLTIQLHELLTHLGQVGVATILIGVHQGFVEGAMTSPGDASYLADSVVLLRYFECAGEVRQAISVVKKRAGPHERTIREFKLGLGGLLIGEPLREFQGVLTGVPTYRGSNEPLLELNT